MSEVLSAAAAALGIPEELAERSAAARAAETGASIEEVLAAWAGGAPAPPPSIPAREAEAPAAASAEPEETLPTTQPETEQPAAAIVEAPPAVAAAPTRAPLPDEVTPGEAAHLPEVITVPTAGIKERTNFVIPKWLTAVLIVAPLIALFALGGSATGECGEATELGTDVVTGEIVNCDGSEFTGQEIGGGIIDFVALGAEIYAGNEVAGVNCAGCHGANGQGAGAFPAMTGVLNTFGACEDHIEWIALGSSGFQAEGRTSYGDTNKAIGGGMPGFEANLTAEQLAAVTAFERVRFASGDPDEELADCGLVPEEGDTDGESGEADMEEAEGTEASVGQTG